MLQVTVIYGDDVRSVAAKEGTLLSEAVIATGLPLEQSCAGRGICGKCKVLAEGRLGPLDEVELEQLTPAEQAANYRLACRCQVLGDVTVTLAPIVVYSNKTFRACDDHLREGVPLGLAIDLGSTTVAAFLTTLDRGQVCAGAAALNQQIVFGADVISRLAAAGRTPASAERLSVLAQASIRQAVDALKLPRGLRARIGRATIVGNCAMHHLLLRYPPESLSRLPFQPHSVASVHDSDGRWASVFPADVKVDLPPLIGGFVGSDALACLTYFGFDEAREPMLAIDLGTNGEVMVTDGQNIVVASTAAGPAFEGVNISCGTRAVDGAIVDTKVGRDGSFTLTTIADAQPVGLTGSGLISVVSELRRAGFIAPGGRFVTDHPLFASRVDRDDDGVARVLLTDKGGDLTEDGGDTRLYLSQRDVRELQKAKGAVRAAVDILLAELGLQPSDLRRLVLTGSFGSQVDVEAVTVLGMIPSVDPSIVETEANGAGFGAALFLDDEQFARGERLATSSRQIDLDLAPDFMTRYIASMAMQD